MVVSERWRYVFIEVPGTASWALRRELCRNYDGVPVLLKHSWWSQIAPLLGAEEGSYTVFATVRNPCDAVVSGYVKLMQDHKGAFSDSHSAECNLTDYIDHVRYRWVHDGGRSFEDYFRAHCRRPYDSMISLSERRLDVVLRYETLDADFGNLLAGLGVQAQGPIEQVNVTIGKRIRWETYYTAGMIEQAVRVLGPFMLKWGYDFPGEWGPVNVTRPSVVRWMIHRQLRMVYLRRVRYSTSSAGLLLRRFRALLG